MKTSSVLVAVGLLCGGCALQPPQTGSTTLLEQADAKMAAKDYGGAQVLYADFVNAHPGDPQAPRARATQTALDRLLGAETELDRARRSDEAPRLRRALSERQTEVDRLKAEVSKLRADLERLRAIDLQAPPGTKK